MSALVIPKKKIPLDQADEKDLKYWVGRIAADLEENPNKQYADRDRALLAGMRAELAKRREAGGAAPAPRAPAAAPSTALATTAPAALAKPAAATAAISLDQVAGNPQAVTERLRVLSESYHLVSPATAVDALPPGFGVATSVVRVDPNPDKKGPGDVVPIGGKLMLSANSLSRIAAAAGIDWDPSRSGRLDNGQDPHYCHFRAVGFVRNFDGSVRTLTGEVEVDAREGSPQVEEIREKAKKRAIENPDDPNDGGASQILELRKFLLRHAERKAKNRAIVDMGVKRSYTKDEIEKPFAVARLMWTGQSDDPELKRTFAVMGAERMLSGQAALYGAQQQPPALPTPAAHPARPLPPFTGHAPPPVGSVNDDPSDYGGYDLEGEGEEVAAPATPATVSQGQPVGEPVGAPVGAPAQAAAPQKQTAPGGAAPTNALPPDQDRGDDPNAY